MTVQTALFRAVVCASPWGTFDDLTVEATGRVREQTRIWWGITLSAADGNRRMVRVTINGNGMIRIDLSRLMGMDSLGHPLHPEELHSIVDRSIRRFDNPNTLVLHVRDHQLTVFVNGEPIGKTMDITPLGRSALMLALDGSKGNQAEFDQMRVWLPEPIASNSTGTK